MKGSKATHALSNTIHTAYDPEGRVIATWGATYPVAYAYDPHGRMTAMGTYRGTNVIETLSDFNFQLSAFDRTTWLYDLPTGLLTNKLYADNLGPSYTYTPDGRLATRTWARGVTTTYSYAASGAMTNIAYSDGTPSVSFAYDRLGRQRTITDATGSRSFAYNDTLQLAAETNAFGVLARSYDGLGRSAGFSLFNPANPVNPVQSITFGYDSLGRFHSVSSFVFSALSVAQYSYLPNSDLISGWSNGILQTVRSFEPNRDLITAVENRAGPDLISRFDYVNDAVARRTARIDHRGAGVPPAITNAFGYNPRSELTSAAMGTNAYGYAFDAIGNREWTRMNANTNIYQSNGLNQYTNILRVSAPPREDLPVFDLDGNQTLLHTTTGSWQVEYNAENRPVLFSNETAIITMVYDHQGRRTEMKVVQSGATTRHERYLYRDYLQLAALDLLDATNVIHVLTWDPTEPVATRPLALQRGTNCWSYGFDQVKNVTELFDSTGALVAAYDYAPFGALTSATGPATALNPLTFSSEIHDTPLGLIYYNYRHLNVLDGRWTNRDPIGEQGGLNIVMFVGNEPLVRSDKLGLLFGLFKGCCNGQVYNRITHCCCCGDKTRRSGGSECKLISRSQLCDTGIKKCYVTPFESGGYPHVYIMIGARSWGFYPNPSMSNPIGGIVYHPDRHVGQGTCIPVVISCCTYKRDKYKANVRQYLDETYQAPPNYIYPVRACGWYVFTALDKGKKGASGCTANCDSFPPPKSPGGYWEVF